MKASDFSLQRLVDPVPRAQFLEDHWERQPLRVHRDEPDYYAPVLSLDEVDRVVTTLHLDNSEINMTDARRELTPEHYSYPSGLVDTARLCRLFADGGTIILPQLQLRVPTLAELCRAMEREFGCRFQSNIYLTPPGNAQGFTPHYDNHCVFVLQVAGTKHWKIYDTPVELPNKTMPFTPDRFAPGAVTDEFELKAGDLLYIPRGVMHDAVSTDALSLHVTLGAMVKTWGDVVTEAVTQAARADPAFRRSLPPGFATPGFDRGAARATFADLLRRVGELADVDALLDAFVEDIVDTRHGLLAGQIDQVRRLEALTLDSRVGARPNLLCRIGGGNDDDGDAVTVSCYGNEVSLPGHAAESLRFALAGRDFAVRDLPGDLDDAGKLVLVRRLVHEGLVMLH